MRSGFRICFQQVAIAPIAVQRKVGADDHAAQLRRLTQEPLEIGMQLRRSASDVHGFEAACLEGIQARLHGFA